MSSRQPSRRPASRCDGSEHAPGACARGSDGSLSAHQAALPAVAAPVVWYGPRPLQGMGRIPAIRPRRVAPDSCAALRPRRAERFLPVEAWGIIGAWPRNRKARGARRMYGRFAQVVKARELAALYDPAASMPDTAWVDRWNGAPTQAFLVCRLDAGRRRGVHLLRWGLAPS